MIIQILTIGGRRLYRQLPDTVTNANEFKQWICNNIRDNSSYGDNCKKEDASKDNDKLYKNIAIRADGRLVSDRLIGKWKQNGSKIHDSKVEDMINVEWSTRGRGGFIMDVIEAIIAIFKFMLFIPKFILWIGSLIIWNFKVIIFLLNVIYQVLSKDGIMGLINLIVSEIVLLPFKLFGYVAKNVVNALGKQTLYGIWGADNARNSTFAKNKSREAPSDSLTKEEDCDGDQKCYIAPDGSVPFSVVVVTVLCPPVGVFMEYGILGWLKIIVCFLLTLMLYFPGLIYALILLYC